ncbi:MAG: sigma-54-dependent Fis family transcriptional regulator [Gemmatimonadetes bacterium]|nr:sigma-54-dependent Fis family transcriptional regulator [Gemmatimonadota bacterium]
MDELSARTGIIGESETMQRLRALVQRAAPLSLPVLIEGPTGSGKELVARALHTLSGRRGRFVAVNVCAIPEPMFEATLFGHVRGAFTGAVRDSDGYLAEADRGTLFLDEIGALSPAAQGKLLRAVETHDFRPVGGRRDCTSDFRVVAATNEPLHALVAGGRFRADLAHRLNAVQVAVPALVERMEDLPALAAHFAALASPGATVALPGQALARLQEHDWPGNVRELKYVVERAVAFAADGAVDAFELKLGRSSDAGERMAERDELLALLAACGWDTEAAARRLGVHRATIYRRMERLEIVRPSRPPDRLVRRTRRYLVREAATRLAS